MRSFYCSFEVRQQTWAKTGVYLEHGDFEFAFFLETRQPGGHQHVTWYFVNMR
jgi:hypothetical protein